MPAAALAAARAFSKSRTTTALRPAIALDLADDQPTDGLLDPLDESIFQLQLETEEEAD